MRQLLAYLLVRRATGVWDVASYRDLEGLVAAWGAVSDPGASAVVHVGFWRPDTGAFEDAASKQQGVVLLTDAARGALPPSFRSASSPCASVDGLLLFEAYSGWGYERGEVDHQAPRLDVLSRKSSSPESLVNPPPAISSQWLALLKVDVPTLWAAAEAAGIHDDAAYVVRESSVPYPERDDLAYFRYSSFTGGPPTDSNILDSLGYAPPWLLNLDVKALDLSTRPSNRLAERKVQCVGDIAQFGEAGLFKMPNMGRRSVAEIAGSILEAFNKGSIYCSAHRCKPAQMVLSGLDPRQAHVPESAGVPMGPTSFTEALNQAFELLGEREAKVLRLRM